MNVFLTFDIEVWCPSWENLDENFPSAFQRYVYGRSKFGAYALPKTLDILVKHGLHGVFFVEPLFAARFGLEYLARIVELIQSAGQEIQLHLHPEWVDEIKPPLLPNSSRKRQHLSYYDLNEQTELIANGVRLLKQAGVPSLQAFRAGSFAANSDTFAALEANGILFDSSLNAAVPISAPDIQRNEPAFSPRLIGNVSAYPVTVFRDGLGKLRHAQIGACSSWELQEALRYGERNEMEAFVLFSHNFEMLKPSRSDPDWIVVKRFQQFCRFLSNNPSLRPVGFRDLRPIKTNVQGSEAIARSGLLATSFRLFEQGLRNSLARLS